MKAGRWIFCLAICSCAVACGNSTTATNTNDTAATYSDAISDGTDSDATNDTISGSDVATGDTIGNDGILTDASDVTDATGSTYTTCAAVTDCAQAACANSSDPACASTCLSNGTPAASSAATALLSCIETKCIVGACQGSQDPKCMSDCTTLRCMPTIFACIEDGKSGTGTCGDVKTCFDTCNAAKTNVMSCMQGCYEKVSPDGKAKGKAFGDCIANATGPGDPTSVCMKQTLGCFLDGKTGTKGCYDSMPCLAKCDSAADSFNCAMGCFGQMSQAAQDAYIDAAPCLGKDVTATAGCEDKLVVCLAPTGTQTCAEALDCVMSCNNNGSNGDPGCMFICLHNTTADAEKLLFSKLGCNQTDATCAASIVQCIAPTGTATCPAVVNCASACGAGQGQPPDMKCVFGCIQKGSTETATTAYAAMNCGGNASPACNDTLVACYNPSGNGNCASLTSCVQACYNGGGDIIGCQTTCYGQASPQGFKDFFTYSACQQNCNKSCKNDQTCATQCVNQQCTSSKGACLPT